MRHFFFTFVATAMIAGVVPACAGDKITVEQAIPLATALRNLDGHMVVIKQGAAESTVMIPWDFGNGALRLRVSNNIAITDAAVKAADEARQAIVKELMKKADGSDIKPGTPSYDEFQRQYAEVMKQSANGTQDLARIKASELKLDRNEIPVTVLSALRPILDDDVSPKQAASP